MVRMPHNTACNTYSAGGETLSKWYRIQSVLENVRDGFCASSRDLEDAITDYNPGLLRDGRAFAALHEFFNEFADAGEVDDFFKTLLPQIAGLALQLPELVPTEMPLLQPFEDGTVELSQKQCAVLLANALFCTFPPRARRRMPGFGFDTLYAGECDEVRATKFRCLLNYFGRVCRAMPKGTVRFDRCSLKMPIEWDELDAPLCGTDVRVQGTIEDTPGMVQVDFANRFIGGGVLGRGSVQEEIRFLICPEMIVSRLFVPPLRDEEALLLVGCERFSSYTGYASTFRFDGDYVDLDSERSLVVAIDATRFDYRDQQFTMRSVSREITKAYAGFADLVMKPLPRAVAQFREVATGNWGCGVFNGDLHLKSLLQVMAATAAQRKVVYFTFGDQTFADDLVAVLAALDAAGSTVCDLWAMVRDYCDGSHWRRRPLFAYITARLRGEPENEPDDDPVAEVDLDALTEPVEDDDRTEEVPPERGDEGGD